MEEGNILSETLNDAKSGNESNDNSKMPPLLSEEEMDAIDSGDESDRDIISTDMLEDLRDRSHSCPNVNRREARYKIRNRIKRIQSKWKGALKAMRNMSKGLHQLFKTVVKDISQDLPPLGESSSKYPISFHNPETFLK